MSQQETFHTQKMKNVQRRSDQDSEENSLSQQTSGSQLQVPLVQMTRDHLAPQMMQVLPSGTTQQPHFSGDTNYALHNSQETRHQYAAGNHALQFLEPGAQISQINRNELPIAQGRYQDLENRGVLDLSDQELTMFPYSQSSHMIDQHRYQVSEPHTSNYYSPGTSQEVTEVGNQGYDFLQHVFSNFQMYYPQNIYQNNVFQPFSHSLQNFQNNYPLFLSQQVSLHGSHQSQLSYQTSSVGKLPADPTSRSGQNKQNKKLEKISEGKYANIPSTSAACNYSNVEQRKETNENLMRKTLSGDKGCIKKSKQTKTKPTKDSNTSTYATNESCSSNSERQMKQYKSRCIVQSKRSSEGKVSEVVQLSERKNKEFNPLKEILLTSQNEREVVENEVRKTSSVMNTNKVNVDVDYNRVSSFHAHHLQYPTPTREEKTHSINCKEEFVHNIELESNKKLLALKFLKSSSQSINKEINQRKEYVNKVCNLEKHIERINIDVSDKNHPESKLIIDESPDGEEILGEKSVEDECFRNKSEGQTLNNDVQKEIQVSLTKKSPEKDKSSVEIVGHKRSENADLEMLSLNKEHISDLNKELTNSTQYQTSISESVKIHNLNLEGTTSSSQRPNQSSVIKRLEGFGEASGQTLMPRDDCIAEKSLTSSAVKYKIKTPRKQEAQKYDRKHISVTNNKQDNISDKVKTFSQEQRLHKAVQEARSGQKYGCYSRTFTQAKNQNVVKERMKTSSERMAEKSNEKLPKISSRLYKSAAHLKSLNLGEPKEEKQEDTPHQKIDQTLGKQNILISGKELIQTSNKKMIKVSTEGNKSIDISKQTGEKHKSVKEYIKKQKQTGDKTSSIISKEIYGRNAYISVGEQNPTSDQRKTDILQGDNISMEVSENTNGNNYEISAQDRIQTSEQTQVEISTDENLSKDFTEDAYGRNYKELADDRNQIDEIQTTVAAEENASIGSSEESDWPPPLFPSGLELYQMCQKIGNSLENEDDEPHAIVCDPRQLPSHRVPPILECPLAKLSCSWIGFHRDRNHHMKYDHFDCLKHGNNVELNVNSFMVLQVFNEFLLCFVECINEKLYCIVQHACYYRPCPSMFEYVCELSGKEIRTDKLQQKTVATAFQSFEYVKRERKCVIYDGIGTEYEKANVSVKFTIIPPLDFYN